MTSIFEFDTYLGFLKKLISENRAQRGYQKQLSSRAGCHPTFLSQVLGGRIHLSQEHALGIAEYAVMSQAETDYFVALVDHARAGSQRLRKYAEAKKVALKAGHEKTSGGKPIREMRLSTQEQDTYYYGKWYVPAIHLLLDIPKFQSPEAIAERVGIPLKEVRAVLEQLESMELIRRDHGKWKLQRRQSHLSPHSAVADHYQSLWRMKGCVHVPKESTLRYTGVHTISRQDVLNLRALISEFLQAFRDRVAVSSEEELVAFTLDYFVV